MSVTFKKAKREGVSVIAAFIGGTGSGKTKSAMELAAGLSGGRRFAFIDTEAGRGLHYADEYDFDHADLKPPFRPDAFADAIIAAEDAGYPAIVVDSGSHGWFGEGGVLDWREEILERMVERRRNNAKKYKKDFDEWQARESCNFASWIEPKVSWKRFVQTVVQVRAHIIFCFRAEKKIEIVKDGNGRTKVQDMVSPIGRDGWMPICEKNFPYEATLSFLFTADQPGVPQFIKLQGQHRPFFPEGRVVTKRAGEELARWAAGEQARAQDHHEPQRRGERVPTIDEVRRVIEEAQVPEDLAPVQDMTRRFTSKERAEIRTLFELKRAELYAKPKTDEPGDDFSYGPDALSDEESADMNASMANDQ